MPNAINYECPLLNELIDADFCLEINYEYLDMFKTTILEKHCVDKKIAETVCSKCIHYPL